MRFAHAPQRMLLVLAALALLTHATTSLAKSKQTYYFLIHDVNLASGVPAEVAAQVRDQIVRAIDAHQRLIGVLPEDAPDPQADPKAFEKYIHKHKIRPYRVNVDVKEYRHEVEELAEPRRGQRLTVGIALHVFGETMPVRKIAFTGDGSSTIKMDIGKQLRPRDTETANRQAIGLAVNDAITISLQKLDAPDQTTKKGRGAKK